MTDLSRGLKRAIEIVEAEIDIVDEEIRFAADCNDQRAILNAYHQGKSLNTLRRKLYAEIIDSCI
jgi:hypothetical protein